MAVIDADLPGGTRDRRLADYGTSSLIPRRC
jgi:hypothetical protein